MRDRIPRTAAFLSVLFLVVMAGALTCYGEVLQGKVTSLFDNGIEIDIGSEKGVRVGDIGRVYYTVMVNDKERPVYVAAFKITHLSTRSSIAQVEEKTVDIGVGFLAEMTVKKSELETRSEPSGSGEAGMTGDFSIRTDPAGAGIYINGSPVGSSPYAGKALPPGTSRVKVIKEGYQPWETEVAVEAGKRVEILAYLKPVEGSLEILSEPPGARVALDGKEIGETPLAATRVLPGEHLIRIGKEEYVPYEERMEVKGGEKKTVLALLKKMAGELLVSTEPEDADIHIDGRPVGRSPYESKVLSPGPHKVKIVKEGYEVWERDVVVRAEKRVEVLTKLNEKKREAVPAPASGKSGPAKEVDAKGIPKATKVSDLARKRCEAPVWKVGDQWTYRKKTGDGWVQEVVDFKEDAFILRISGHLELEAFDRKTMNQAFLIGKDGRKVTNADNPFKKLLDFPLSVGKKWSYSTRSRFSVSGQPAADVVLFNEFKVEGVEEVVTPAGTFPAYKIQHRQEVVSSVPKDAMSGNNGWVRYWYSPDAKTWIKREFEKTPFWPGSSQDAELISFDLK
jgi:hypothetical protein